MWSIILSLVICYRTFRFNSKRCGWDLFVFRVRSISHWLIITCHERTMDYMMAEMTRQIQEETDNEILGKMKKIACDKTFN